MSNSIVRLHYAASEHDADLLYATRFFVPDAFLWWDDGKKTHAVLSSLEIDRARRTAYIDKIWSFDDFFSPEEKKRGAVSLIAAVARKQRFSRIEVPGQFPLHIAAALEKRKIRVKPVEGAFFPERERKSADEIRAITQALRLAEDGLRRGIEVLKASKPGRDGILRWGSAKLTSEILRGEIDAAIIKKGGLPSGTIVAGGDQACDPHERGSGFLRANEAIILDVFPRDQKTGYFGDLTRTVVRGRASDRLKHLYATVAEGKKWVMQQMKPGADGMKLHETLVQRFKDKGYPTEKRNGRWTGFFHGTGHSLGLEIHEAPRFSATRFFPGLIMTVEPGLYIPGLGGVRLEDLVVVKKGGIENLTRVPQVLEI